MPRTYVALDLELTGLDRQRDEIIEVALVRFKGSEILDTFSSLVHTRRPVSPRIEQMIGLSSRDVVDAPRLEQLRGEILRFVSNYPLVAHSIETDLFFLQKQGLSLQNVALDTFELASILVPEANTYSLVSLSEMMGIPLPDAHRALPDALATQALFAALVTRFDEWDLPLLREILSMAQASAWSLWPLLQDVIQDRETRTGMPLLAEAPSSRAFRGSEFANLPREPDDAPPLAPAADITPIDPDPLVAAISPGGALARIFPGYEYRPQQVEMLKAVAEAFNAPEHLLVEAGTGTGKSLAYLLPAIQFATQNERRVVVSSNTINLQDQLYTKDIPDLQHLLKQPFRAALLKGRGNYICLRRLSTFRRSRQMTIDGVRVLAKVMAWLPKTHTGDQSELLLLNAENGIWKELQATSETCIGDRCPYHSGGRCFFHRARSRAEHAHLVVVNHALLLSDLMLENRILPEYDYVIIDEAHHLEEQATNQFGLEIARQDVAAFLGALSQPGVTGPSGLLGQIPALFDAYQVSDPVRQTIADQIERMANHIDSALANLDTLFRILTLFLEDYQEPGAASQGAYDRTVRITPGLRIQPGWSDIEIASDNLAAPLKQIVQGLEQLAAWITRLPDEEDQLKTDMLLEVKSQLQRGTEICHGIDQILVDPNDDFVYWVSVSQYNQEVALHSAPIHVGELLNERLFTDKECVILTSATLRTDREFGYIEDRLGMERPTHVAVDSPFDFQSAVLLYVPKDIPEPNEPYYQKNVEQAIVSLVQATEGRALVLFTSNSQLNATYRATHSVLEKEGIIVLGQGIDGSRRQILESFRATPRAVLMGTRSFWEGVDVVGSSLSCLIITRLPFAVPDDPILTARSETFEDPFNQYYLPETILRFRQGFGRLIRSKEDFGVVAVLDKRLITKTYGKAILRSLPPCTARMGPIETLPVLARRWLDPERFSTDRAGRQ
jgi:DNA polymerase-3 subunit epsilon/ATP-dependent DNA helicase DinG